MDMSADAIAYWADIATIVTAVAVLIAILTFVGDRQQRHREFENLYVQRYWTVVDRHSNAFQVRGEMRKSDERVVVDYLRLCEDQIEVRGLGLITHKTWRVWGPSIRAAVQEPRLNSTLDYMPADSFTGLRKFCSDGRDPYFPHGRIHSAFRKAWSKVNGL